MLSQKSEPTSRPNPRASFEQSREAVALKARLNQIYSSYQQSEWTQVLTQCEAIMAHCRQKLSRETASVTSTADSASPSVSNVSGSNSSGSNSSGSNSKEAPDEPANNVKPAPTATASTSGTAAAELYLAKADLFEKQGKIADAIQAYEQALELEPQRIELLRKIGSLYAQQTQQAKTRGSVADAVRIYLQALEKHPRLFSAYNRLRYNLMRYDIAAGDPILTEVVASSQKVVGQNPTLLPAKITLAYALTKSGQKESAIATYRSASELFTRRQISEKVAGLKAADVSFSAQPPQPDFMIIGAEKSGTTSLYQYLRRHPNVLSSVEKEIDFFDMEYEQGIDWYLAHFPPVPESTPAQSQTWLTGETSANYLYSDAAPQRVFEHFPHIKLAVILRNPIDRTVSRYSMMVRNGAEPRSLETVVKEEIALIQRASARFEDGQTIPYSVLNRCRHVGNSLYYYHLKRWLTCFSKEQLFVLQSENLFEQPAQTLSHLYSKFGLSAHTIQDYPKHNSGSYSPAESAVRQTLSDFFAPHTRKLEALLGRTFDWNL